MTYFKIYKSQRPKDKVWIRVSKKVSKKAVVRNKVKRRIKQIVQIYSYSIDPNYIISALPGIENIEWYDLYRDLVDTLKNKGII